MKLKAIVVDVTIFILILMLIVFIIGLIGNRLPNEETYVNCCDGQQCSDTYYSADDNLCHLVLCESNILFNQNCTYPGKNISLVNID